jgi:uncharacterized membrane protein YgaE (UPF0421/DUF939 family)
VSGAPKLEGVLAHERSHIRRRDPAIQVLSAIHRALLWYNPLSWHLDRQIVRLAEEASDDEAVAAIRDHASYADLALPRGDPGLQPACSIFHTVRGMEGSSPPQTEVCPTNNPPGHHADRFIKFDSARREE